MLDPALEAEGLGPSRFSESLAADWAAMRVAVAGAVEGRKVLVVGGAGAIGAATTRQLRPDWKTARAMCSRKKAGSSGA